MRLERPQTLMQKLDEAEMLADGPAERHIREVREEIDQFYDDRRGWGLIYPFIGVLVSMLIGVLIGLSMAGGTIPL